jgi:hypothetical protein
MKKYILLLGILFSTFPHTYAQCLVLTNTIFDAENNVLSSKTYLYDKSKRLLETTFFDTQTRPLRIVNTYGSNGKILKTNTFVSNEPKTESLYATEAGIQSINASEQVVYHTADSISTLFFDKNNIKIVEKISVTKSGMPISEIKKDRNGVIVSRETSLYNSSGKLTKLTKFDHFLNHTYTYTYLYDQLQNEIEIKTFSNDILESTKTSTYENNKLKQILHSDKNGEENYRIELSYPSPDSREEIFIYKSNFLKKSRIKTNNFGLPISEETLDQNNTILNKKLITYDCQ